MRPPIRTSPFFSQVFCISSGQFKPVGGTPGTPGSSALITQTPPTSMAAEESVLPEEKQTKAKAPRQRKRTRQPSISQQRKQLQLHQQYLQPPQHPNIMFPQQPNQQFYQQPQQGLPGQPYLPQQRLVSAQKGRTLQNGVTTCVVTTMALGSLRYATARR